MTLDINYNTTNPRNVDKAIATEVNNVSFLVKSSKRSTAAAQKVFSGAGTAVGAGLTIINQIPSAADFSAVQLVYANWSGSAVTINGAKVASAPTHQNDGAALTWSTVTFAGSTLGTVPAAVSGTGNDIVPGFLVSDVIPVTSVARTDDTTKSPLLQVRTYSAGASSAISLGGTDIANFNASSTAGGMQWAARIPAGDLVTTLSASQPLEAGTWINPASVKFFHNTEAFTVATIGDSLTRGQGSTSGAAGWPARLQQLQPIANTKVGLANFAWSGQLHAASMGIGKQVISGVKPNALVFFAWSPNDAAGNDATMNSTWARTLEMIELCRQNGVIPIVCTSGPVNSYTAQQDARIKAQNTRVRQLPNIVFDFASVLEDTADRSKILPAYDSGDGLHYSDAGYQAMANLAATVLAQIK